MKKRILSLLLVAIMIIGLLPISAMAATGNTIKSDFKVSIKGGIIESLSFTTGTAVQDSRIAVVIIGNELVTNDWWTNDAIGADVQTQETTIGSYMPYAIAVIPSTHGQADGGKIELKASDFKYFAGDPVDGTVTGDTITKLPVKGSGYEADIDGDGDASNNKFTGEYYVIVSPANSPNDNSNTATFAINETGNIVVPSGKITFNVNGATTGTTATDVAIPVSATPYDSAALAALPGAPTGLAKTGYKFLGWSESSSASSADASITCDATSFTKTVYAVWVAKTAPTAPTVSAVTYTPTLKLSDITLPTTENGKVAWTWDAPDTTLTVANSGQNFKASAVETDDFAAATAIDVAVTVNKAAQTLTVNPASISVFPGAGAQTVTITSNASGDNGFAAAVSGHDTGVATAGVSGTTITVTPVAVGSTTINVNSPATDNYLAATQATIAVEIKTAGVNDLAISGTIPTDKVYGDEFTVTTTGGNGETITFTPGSGLTLKSSTTNSATFTVTGSTNTTLDISQPAKSDGSVGASNIAQQTITLGKRPLTWDTSDFAVDNKVYDGKTDAAITSGKTLKFGNVATGDTITLSAAPTVEFADKNVGASKTVTVNVSGITASGTNATHYALPAAAPTANAGITPKPLAGITGITATKTYDGDATMDAGEITIGTPTFNGMETGDTLSVTANNITATYSSSNVHTSVAGTVTAITLGGADAGNYSITPANVSLTGTITRATHPGLTITGIPAGTITYGDSTFTVDSTGQLGDGTVTYDIGTGKGTVASISGTTVTILKPGAFTVTAVQAQGTNYEASTTVTSASKTVDKKKLDITPTTLTYVLAQSGVTLSDAITITPDLTGLQAAPALTFTLSGASGTNAAINGDSLTFTTTGTAQIDVTLVSSDYYEFDGAKSVALTIANAPALTGTWSGTTTTYGTALNPTFAPTPSDAGTITYKYCDTVDGTYEATVPTDVGDYFVKAYSSETAKYSETVAEAVKINKKTVTIATTATKVYDGKADMALTEVNGNDLAFENADISDIVSGDTITITGLGTTAYANKTAQTAAATVAGAAFSGADNYDVTLTISGTISKQDLTVTTVQVTKTYDTTTNLDADDITAIEAATITGVVSGDTVKIDVTGIAYPDANVDADYVTLVAANAISFTGTDAGNYKLGGSNTGVIEGKITQAAQAALTLTGVGTTATYGDAEKTLGTTGGSGTGAVTYTLTANADGAASIAGDKLTILKPGSFTIKATKAADTNYSAIDSAEITCTVSQKELTVDPNTLALSGKVSEGITGIVLADTVKIPDAQTQGLQAAPALEFGTITAGSTGANYNPAGTIKWTAEGTATLPVTIAANDYYTLAAATVTLTVTAKTPQTITFGTVPTDKTYGDAAFNVTATGGTGTGTGSISYTSSDDTVATVDPTSGLVTILKPGTFTLTATKAEDAIYATATATTGTITVAAKALKYTGAVTKVYDDKNDFNEATVTGGAFVGVVGTDNVTIGTIAGTFADTNVHTGKTLTVTSAGTLGGTDAAKYTLAVADVTITTAITAKPLTGITTTITKVYDGTDTMSEPLTGTFAGMETGDNLTIESYKAVYSSKDVHTDSVVNPTALTLGGTDKNNYSVPAMNQIAITQSITARPITVVAAAGAVSNSDTSIKLSALVKLDTGFTLGTGDTIDSIFGSIGTTEIGAGTPVANDKGVKVTIQNETPENVTALPLTAGDYTYSVDTTGFAAINKNYTVTCSITGADLIVTKPSDPGPITSGVTFNAGSNGKLLDKDGKEVSSVKVDLKDKLPEYVPEVKASENYKFMGWSTDNGKTFVDPAKVEVSASATYTAIFAKYDHLPYIVGRTASSFAPDGQMTRAEAATMLARLSGGFSEDGVYDKVKFSDVEAGAWYAAAVGFAAEKGIVEGYDDGSFKPDRSISRAEFTALISRFLKLNTAGLESSFGDCKGHWADGHIAALVKQGAIEGYPDGSFRPDQTITRAEAVKITNAAIGRTPDEATAADRFEGYKNPFADVSKDAWYFYNVMEASLLHVASDFHSGK